MEEEFPPEIVNQLMSALSHEDNRSVVNYFREASGNVASLDEIAEYVANTQNECGSRSSEEIAIRLHHAGLPKLVEAGILDYDPRSRTVSCCDHPLFDAESLSNVVETA